MKKANKKAMSLPSLERVKNMAFIKRTVLKKNCLKKELSLKRTVLKCQWSTFKGSLSRYSCTLYVLMLLAAIIFTTYTPLARPLTASAGVACALSATTWPARS